MKHTNDSELSFVYQGNPNEIARAFAVCNTACPVDANVILTGIDAAGHLLYSTALLFDNSYDHIANARLQIAMQNGQFEGIELKKMSRTAVKNKEREERPIMVFKKNIVLAEKLGIMPWHTMYFAGKYVYVYIWDMRIVERVLSIEESAGISKLMLKPAIDSLQPLILQDDASIEVRANFNVKSMHPAFYNGTQLDAILSIQ